MVGLHAAAPYKGREGDEKTNETRALEGQGFP